MFFKCFHELSAALTRSSYRGEALQQQLKVLSQTFYVSCCSGKHEVAARNSHKARVPALTQEQHSRMTAFNPIKPPKFCAGWWWSIYQTIRRARMPSSCTSPTPPCPWLGRAPQLRMQPRGARLFSEGHQGQGCCRSPIRTLLNYPSQPTSKKITIKSDETGTASERSKITRLLVFTF